MNTEFFFVFFVDFYADSARGIPRRRCRLPLAVGRRYSWREQYFHPYTRGKVKEDFKETHYGRHQLLIPLRRKLRDISREHVVMKLSHSSP